MKTNTLCMIILLILHVQTTVSEMVQCYDSFSLSRGTCGEILGSVPFDDCCMNPKYGYKEKDSECKSCRLASWTEWSRWSSCSVTCTEGVKQRRRACYGIGKCQDRHDIGSVQTKPCVDNDCCPENGGWSEWSAWQPCSVTCATGIKKRMRTCSDPFPKCEGTCEGNSEDTEDCSTGIVCPTHGGWSSWNNWGPCAGTCQVEGISIPEQDRKRTCTNPPPSVVPRGNDCSGPSIEHRHCTTLPFCPVHGNWGSWSVVSDCSVTCGVGRQTQHRKCDSPAPKYGGLDCLGSAFKQVLCTIPTNCPADGHWSEWTEWSNCETTSNRPINCRNIVGKRRRIRQCLGREYEGNYCPDDSWELSHCYDIEKCTVGPDKQIPGAYWSDWSEWSYCKPNCGKKSEQTRNRVCTPDLSKYRQKTADFSGTPKINCSYLPKTEEKRPCFNLPAC